jgi:hypothetical protein
MNGGKSRRIPNADPTEKAERLYRDLKALSTVDTVETSDRNSRIVRFVPNDETRLHPSILGKMFENDASLVGGCPESGMTPYRAIVRE